MTRIVSEIPVPEGSNATLVTTFLDKEGEPNTPSSIDWLVHDLATDTEMGTGTDSGPTNPWELELLSAHNAIVTSTKKHETRRVTIKASFGAGEKQNGQFDYTVKNLSYVP